MGQFVVDSCCCSVEVGVSGALAVAGASYAAHWTCPGPQPVPAALAAGKEKDSCKDVTAGRRERRGTQDEFTNPPKVRPTLNGLQQLARLHNNCWLLATELGVGGQQVLQRVRGGETKGIISEVFRVIACGRALEVVTQGLQAQAALVEAAGCEQLAGDSDERLGGDERERRKAATSCTYSIYLQYLRGTGNHNGESSCEAMQECHRRCSELLQELSIEPPPSIKSFCRAGTTQIAHAIADGVLLQRQQYLFEPTKVRIAHEMLNCRARTSTFRYCQTAML
jgi:hypothetical protein